MISISSALPVIFQAAGFEIGAWNCLKVGKEFGWMESTGTGAHARERIILFLLLLSLKMDLNPPAQEFCRYLAKCWQCGKDLQVSLLADFYRCTSGELWIYENRQDLTQSGSANVEASRLEFDHQQQQQQQGWSLSLQTFCQRKISCRRDLHHAGVKARNSQHPRTTQRKSMKNSAADPGGKSSVDQLLVQLVTSMQPWNNAGVFFLVFC